MRKELAIASVSLVDNTKERKKKNTNDVVMLWLNEDVYVYCTLIFTPNIYHKCTFFYFK